MDDKVIKWKYHTETYGLGRHVLRVCNIITLTVYYHMPMTGNQPMGWKIQFTSGASCTTLFETAEDAMKAAMEILKKELKDAQANLSAMKTRRKKNET